MEFTMRSDVNVIPEPLLNPNDADKLAGLIIYLST